MNLYIIHDNYDWLSNLITQLDKQNIKYVDWNLKENPQIMSGIDLTVAPPKGIFYNRISASSHTRGAPHALEHSKILIQWLEKFGRRVINGSQSLELELSKVKQYIELEKEGVLVPKTYLATSKEQIMEISQSKFNSKCIIKDNRSGSGVGVKLIHNAQELSNYLNSPEYVTPIDGITLVQDYIETEKSFITRIEIVNHKFVYGVKVDTSEGFKLCPADKCNFKSKKNKFQIIQDIAEPNLLTKLINVTKNNQIDICGIEFIRDKNGVVWTYDLNCNTNYNTSAEDRAGLKDKGIISLIDLLKQEGL